MLKLIMKKQMKLSLKQKEVVAFMELGHKMYKNITYVTLQNASGCSVATFLSLFNKGIIKKSRKDKIFGTEYILTNKFKLHRNK